MKEKRKKAIALKYKLNEDTAPKIVAKGSGIIADKIISKAEESNVRVVENEGVTESLFNVEIASEIPTEMFEAVAGILAFVYKMDREHEQ